MGTTASKEQRRRIQTGNKPLDETSSILSDPNNSLSSLNSNTTPDDNDEEEEEEDVTTYIPCEADWPWIWAMQDGEYLDWRRFCAHDPELMVEYLQRQLSMPLKLTSQLYLGDAKCVSNTKRLQEVGITGILNMAGGSAGRKSCVTKKTVTALTKQGIDYRSIKAEDRYEYPLMQYHWDEAKEILDELTKKPDKEEEDTSTNNQKKPKRKKVLVHCVQGINRSCLIVAAYYMITTQTSVLETLRYLRQTRGNQALSNHGFQEQLVVFARMHQLLGPAPGHVCSVVPQRAPARQEPYWTTTAASSSQRKQPSQRSLVLLQDTSKRSHKSTTSRSSSSASTTTRNKQDKKKLSL